MTNLHKETILIVEDDPDLLELAGEYISSLGYQILKAYDAKEALAHLREKKPLDLIFTDIRLPGGPDGVELAKIALEQRPNLKIILTSGFDEYFLKDINPNRFPCLHKPYYPDELAGKIQMVLAAPEIPH